MATDIKAYGKTVSVTSNDGKTYTFSGTRANAVLNRFNDNPDLWHVTADDGSEVYFDMKGPCGMCTVATVAYNSKTIAPLDCEDGIPNCPDATKENPVEGDPAPAK